MARREAVQTEGTAVQECHLFVKSHLSLTSEQELGRQVEAVRPESWAGFESWSPLSATSLDVL